MWIGGSSAGSRPDGGGDDLAGGGFDGGVRVRTRTGSGRRTGRRRRCRPGCGRRRPVRRRQLHQGGAGGRTISLSSLVRALIFVSTATSSATCSAASRRRVLPTTSRGRTVARIVLAWPVVMSFLPCPERVRPGAGAAGWLPGPGSCSARLGGRPASATPPARCRGSTRRPAVRTATTATACASWASVLRLRPVSSSRARADSFAGTSTTCSPSASSRCANGRPAPLLPSTAHARSASRRRTSASPRTRPTAVGVDPDEHARHGCLTFAPSLLVNAGRALLLRAGQTPLQPHTATAPDGKTNRR